jgi:hypothetical protein
MFPRNNGNSAGVQNSSIRQQAKQSAHACPRQRDLHSHSRKRQERGTNIEKICDWLARDGERRLERPFMRRDRADHNHCRRELGARSIKVH